jgi:23S rRNA (uridine2552-2'-O)-methyltransferase
MSKLSDRRTRKDSFHKRARQQGYRARSVFKLAEIDDRFDLLSTGVRVLDLGCAPGSWLQYAAEKVGPQGALVGVDRTEIHLGHPRFRMVVGDIHDIDPAVLVGDLRAFDIVMSDMAPDTTGIRHADQARSEALFERALDIAEATLDRGGHFLAKLFQGPEFKQLIDRCRTGFETVKPVKPAGSRTESIEQYIVCRGKK